MSGAAAAYRQAVVFHKAGELAAAAARYREALAHDAGFAPALKMLGVLTLAQGDAAAACGYLRQAAERLPEDAGLWSNLGSALNGSGEPEAAAAALQRALDLDPDLAPARFNLANLLAAQGALEEAAAGYEAILAAHPGNAGAGNNLALVLKSLGRLDEAAEVLGRILAATPAHADAHINLGVIRMEQGRPEQAVEHYRRAVALAPGKAEAANNLGVALLELGRAGEAVEVLRSGLRLSPDSAPLLDNLGNALRRLGESDEAARAYESALSIRPNSGMRIKRALLLPVIPDSATALADARGEMAAAVAALTEDPPPVGDPLAEVGMTNFHLAYHDAGNGDLQRRIARMYLAACPGLAWQAPHCGGGRRRPGPLRIGFVSRHLRNHAIGRCFEGLIRHLPRRDLHLTLFAPAVAGDSVWEAIAASADAVKPLPAGLEAARQALAAEEFDAVVYTDIGMEPLTYYTAFARLAPFQCALWGHPDTTGVPNLDAFVAYDAPVAAGEFSEPLIHFPGFPTHYARPALPAKPKDRAALGLPADRRLYFCAQTLFKVHPDMDALFGNILDADPEGMLLLPAGTQPHWADLLDRRLRRELGGRHDRVRFLPPMPHEDFMAVLAAADVALDTRPFGGGNTTLQAVAVGTPVVNWPPPWLRGRFSRMVYEHLGVADCTVWSAEAYVRQAVRLARERDYRHSVNARIAEGAESLFGDTRAVDAFAAYLTGRAIKAAP